MEHLKLSPRTWRIGGDEGVLGPTENGIHANFLRGDDGNGDVFRDVAEIQDVRLNRQAFAEVLRIRLHNPVAPAVAGGTKQSEQCDHTDQKSFLQGLHPFFNEWRMGVRRRNLVPVTRRQCKGACWLCSPLRNLEIKPKLRSRFIKSARWRRSSSR